MNISVSVFGRFHAFNLAHQLHRRGHLQKLITSYPKFEVKKYGVPRRKTCSLLHYEVLKRGYAKINNWVELGDGIDRFLKKRFERAAARQITTDTDISVGWSGTAESGLRRAKELGVKPVLERGSGHIQHQMDLLEEEGRRFDVDVGLPSPRAIEKEKKEYSCADAIVIPSTFAEESFTEYGVGKQKLVKVPYGVDPQEFRPIEKKDQTFRVVYAGRMTLQKGVHYLLEAFSELDLPDSELWLIGTKTSEIEPFFDQYQSHFTFLGHKPQSELYKYYSQGSVFALCSIQDGFGMVLLQAMTCGLPIISTVHTGGPDVVRDGEEGFNIPVRDVETLKEKILWYYENPEERNRMGANARDRALDHFQWSDYGDQVIREYRELIE